MATGIKGKVMSTTATPIINEIEIYCLRMPSGICTCDSPPCDWRTCEVCGKTICATTYWQPSGGGDEPTMEPPVRNPLDPLEPTTPIGNTHGGGGVSNIDDYPPTCNPDPNYSVPSYPAPSGHDWVMSCFGLPFPNTGGNDPTTRKAVINNFMGITNHGLQNFLLANNDIYDALVNYLVLNGNTAENKEFVDWAVGYLMKNPNTPLDKINVALVKSPNIRISFADRINYPILAKIIDGLHAKVKNDPKLMAAIKKFSQMNETQILEKLISGKGPNLVLKDMPLNEYGEEIGDGNIYINKVYATGFYNIQVLPPQSLEFFLTSCILHEFVHFGNTVVMDRFPSKRDSGGYFWDAGKQFEEDYYGGDIGYDISTGKIIFTKYQ